MLIKKASGIKSSEITPESVYRQRRLFMQGAALGVGAALLPSMAAAVGEVPAQGIARYNGDLAYKTRAPAWLQGKVAAARQSKYATTEPLAPWDVVTTYNNFYEFGTDKGDPAENARNFRVDPWQVEIAGEAEITGKFGLEDMLKPHDIEERIYRMRCVEAWSMVVPWNGFPLVDLIKRFKPTSKARFVRFETLVDAEQMPGQRSRFTAIDYPYVEGLRMDEALNELAFVGVGLYGQAMPPQNGAPLRLVIPWKYGFKSIKSIVKIEFLEKRPTTTWERSNSREYGFYANVNPQVSHPRWSQASERRLPTSLFSSNRRPTQLFNGYAEQVAYLYAGMNLARDF
jgi:methionine sulfoxide reductase catalytic subunit